MTANAMSGDKEKVIEVGMCDHIAKPLNVGEMFNTIAKWIKPETPTEAQPAASASEQAPLALNNLPGIDVSAGLATTMNNEKLYLRLLTKFCAGQRDFAEQFREACAGDDASAPARVAHTLKGTAGNIGAKGIQAAAGDLEHACLAGENTERLTELLKKTLAELEPVIAVLTAFTAVGETPPVKEASVPSTLVDAGKLDALLTRLRAMLADSDSAASDVLDEIIELTQGTPLAVKLKQVANAVANYDFDVALEQLEISIG
jgi:two-component system sensor histidine kinase/response regulator